MAVQTFDTAPSNADNTLFRAWTLAAHTAIAAILTYVAQAGEIDFTTVTFPSAPNTYKGFRVYRFNDGLFNFYMRVDFGSGTSNALHPALKFTFGTGVDGSGNFLSGTNHGSTTAKVVSFNSSSASVFRSWVSGTGGSLRFILWPQATPPNTSVPFCNLERQPDAAGAATDSGVEIFLAGGAGSSVMQGILTKEGVFVDSADGAGVMSSAIRANVTSALFGLKSGAFPLHYYRGPLVPPPRGVQAYFSSDAPVTAWPQTISLSVYGAAHTYLICGVSFFQLRNVSNTAHSLLMLLE